MSAIHYDDFTAYSKELTANVFVNSNMHHPTLLIRGGGEIVSSRKMTRRDVSCLVSSRDFISRDKSRETSFKSRPNFENF